MMEKKEEEVQLRFMSKIMYREKEKELEPLQETHTLDF
jgi:hypothetical protein